MTPKRLDVTAEPGYSLEPARVNVRILHDPRAGDRQMTVEAESADFFRSSAFPLEGEAASRLHEIVLKALPAGRYRLRVTIDGTGGEGAESGGTFVVCDARPASRTNACDPPSGATARTGSSASRR